MAEEQNGAVGDNKPDADQRIAELERQYQVLQQRYDASSQEGKRLAQLIQQQSYEMNRQSVPQRDSAGQRLTDSGLPVDALDEYIEQKADALVAKRFEPLMQGMQARQKMVGRYKDYAKFETDIGELINGDPDFQQTYNRVFQADPVAAFELAYHRLGETKRRSRGSAKNEAVDGADLSEAQIPNQRSGDSRRIPGGYDAVLQAAERAYRENPNRVTKDAFVRARLKTAISDDFLNQ